MNSSKEKAIKLFEKYDSLCRDHTRGVSIKDLAKECSLISVEEVLNYSKAHGFIELTEYYEQIIIEIKKL
jgi:hypothetical protein